MSNYCFFAADALDLISNSGLKDYIEEFATTNKKQVYALRKPLSKDDSTYDYDNAIALFASGMNPCFIDIGKDQEAFDDYIEDFLEDISFLSEKFKYREKIGRKKNWGPIFKEFNSDNFNFESLVASKASESRVSDLISSLVVGSINDVSKIKIETSDLLESVKSKIILFDTDQTSFVFKSGLGKKFVIQGLAGSGKTELLLHKLKEIYSRDTEARIAFTCFNKILASSMRSRIPGFFDFMRVERQIDWGNKLFCFHSWGSTNAPMSGMYRYICHSYGIPFGSLQAGSFDYLCQKAIKEIKALNGEEKHIFDYVFIDESQDFASSFIELCELVTAKKIFVAGDVFQNIFRPIDEGVNRADMVLKKCYRTDPKNLMFSHALGMGLFEKPVLRWLQPNEWDACGYTYQEEEGRAGISRDPLRRFEDIPADFRSTIIHELEDTKQIHEKILEIVKTIIKIYPTTTQGDIAVIFLDKENYIYDEIRLLKGKIIDELDWDVNVSFETKRTDPEKFFISNINNAKGLEFPFVICFATELKTNPSFRNALYTMMARSFLESHLLVESKINDDILSGLEFLTKNNYMNVRIPTEEEIKAQQEFIVLDELPSIENAVRKYCAERDATPRLVGKIISRLNKIIGEGDYDEDYLNALIKAEYDRHLSL